MAALPAILDGAAASGAGLGETADYVTNILTSFNLEANQAGLVVDLMVRAAGASPASMSEMGQALSNAGGMAREFGMGIEDVTGIMTVFARQGIVGPEAESSSVP